METFRFNHQQLTSDSVNNGRLEIYLCTHLRLFYIQRLFWHTLASSSDAKENIFRNIFFSATKAMDVVCKRISQDSTNVLCM